MSAEPAAPPVPYSESGPASAEPTAVFAVRRILARDAQAALPSLRWLQSAQRDSGGVAPRPGMTGPLWCSGPAMWAWAHAVQSGATEFIDPARRARAWAVAAFGEALQRSKKLTLGHDVRLRAWPWVQGTHSWIEPSCWQIIGLHALQQIEPDAKSENRIREAVSLVLDRQLSGGGWNYGNTSVLGQELRPHVQPTALALLALRCRLADWECGYVHDSLQWLEGAFGQPSGGVSGAWAELALRSWSRQPPQVSESLRPRWFPNRLRDELEGIAKCEPSRLWFTTHLQPSAAR